MAKSGAKQISDPIHGIIGLSELEVAIVETRSFQRLRNVKQLGLAHYVFPGADYSRFSHSVGACHVMGDILNVLREHDPGIITDDLYKTYRVAALLHDVGHYPFSHATEYAIDDYYKETVTSGDGETLTSIKHEDVTGLLLREDPQISTILKTNDIDPKTVEDIIRRTKPQNYLSNLISSDVDADRIDYLLRTAHHAGLPYQSVDIEYLMSQMRLDNVGRVCVTQKALRAADHMLLCRYFDYQQVVYHKVVAGIEWVLKGCVADVLRAGLDASEKAITEMVKQGAWTFFDDGQLTEHIRYRLHQGDADVRLRADAVLNRKPPVVLYQDEDIVPRTQLDAKDRLKLYRQAEKTIVEKYGVPKTRLKLWTVTPMTLTKIGGKVDASELDDPSAKQRDALGQALRILNADGTSQPLMENKRSLMSVLSEHGVRPIRLYALLNEEELKRVADMKKDVAAQLA